MKVRLPLQQALSPAPPVRLPAQDPLQQTVPLAHMCVQKPQLFGSVLVLTQTPVQLVVPLGQPVPQLPFAQVWPEAQTLPQAPQLLGSEPRFTHAPVQSVCPVGQPHSPP
jgi:hypothetical protein